MADRRRVNGPGAETYPPVYDGISTISTFRQRDSNHVRSFYLKTGVTPSASGSAYLEMDQSNEVRGFGMKLTCTVHGPRSLPRSAPFSPHMVLSTHVKYAPFATRQRRGYLRDTTERDLSMHLETALRGVILADRWPKSGVDVVVTIVEGDVVRRMISDETQEEWDMMGVLSGCITVAAAAVADAGIDCVDAVTSGVAAVVADDNTGEPSVVLDPVSSEHRTILAACCVAYLPTRDEVSSLWFKGQLPSMKALSHQSLIARAIHASKGTSKAVSSSLQESLSPT